MGHSLITAPATEPIALEEMKDHLRVVTDDEDGYIFDLISVARDKIEEYLSLQMVTATWELTQSTFGDPIELPRWPLQSLTSIKYLDENNVEQPLASTIYEEVTNIYPGRVRLQYQQFWPNHLCHDDAVRIRYVAGYGQPEAVPPRAKHAIKMLAAHYYAIREPVVIGTISVQIPEAYLSLLWSLRVR